MTLMESTYDQAEMISVGDGDLVLLEWRPPTLSSYGPYDDATVDRMLRDFRVEYTRGGHMTPVPSLGALRDLAQAQGLSLDEVARGQEYGLALIVRRIMGTWDTVIQPSWRYTWMQDIYGIRLEDYRPRVDGETFRFLLAHLAVAEPRRPLREVVLNLRTMEYEERVVAEPRAP